MGAPPDLKISPSPAYIATDSRSNVAGIDPDSGAIVRLFNPRRDSWMEHFVWNGSQLNALTQIGRVTIAVLLMNDPEVVAMRKALQEEGALG